MNARGLCRQYEMHSVQGINWQIDSTKITFFRQNNFSMIFFFIVQLKIEFTVILVVALKMAGGKEKKMTVKTHWPLNCEREQMHR